MALTPTARQRRQVPSEWPISRIGGEVFALDHIPAWVLDWVDPDDDEATMILDDPESHA